LRSEKEMKEIIERAKVSMILPIFKIELWKMLYPDKEVPFKTIPDMEKINEDVEEKVEEAKEIQDDYSRSQKSERSDVE